MTDTLEIFGVEYTGVTGIIAKDDNGTDLTFTRGGGSPTLQTKTKTYTPTESTQTETVSADSGYDGLSQVNVSVGAISSTYVGTSITRRTSTDLTASGATVTVPSGYYSAQASKAVASMTLPSETSSTNIGGIQASIVPSTSPRYINIPTGYNSVAKSYYLSQMELAPLSVSENGTYNASDPYDIHGFSSVTVSVPTGTARTSSDLTVSGATVTVPAGLYSEQATKSVASGTEGTPTATKGSVSNHSISVTPSVTNSGGYITGSTKTGTAVTVSASELVSGSETKTENGTYDVTNLAELVVAVSGGGSGGLVYETGTLTLSSDESAPIISFINTYTDVPIYINITDVTETLATDNSNLYWTFMNWYTLNDSFIKTTSSSNMYGRYQYGWKTSSGASAGNVDCTNTGTGSGSLYYLVAEDRFGPYCGSTNRYWRAGRTYKWIAVWKPTA